MWLKHQSQENRHLLFLEQEFKTVQKVQKYRTGDIIRLRGFMHILKNSLENTHSEYLKLFDLTAFKKDKTQTISNIVNEIGKLEAKLWKLVRYIEILAEYRMLDYIPNVQTDFEEPVAKILADLFTYVVDPRLLWEISCCEGQLVEERFHRISLGGSQNYYKGVMRSMLKGSVGLREIFERSVEELKT